MERIGRGNTRHARCWVLRDRAGDREVVVIPTSGLRLSRPAAVAAEYRPYFENYTVDASILDSDSSESVIYKMN